MTLDDKFMVVFSAVATAFISLIAYAIMCMSQQSAFTQYIHDEITLRDLARHNLIMAEKDYRSVPYIDVDASFANEAHAQPWDRDFGKMVVNLK